MLKHGKQKGKISILGLSKCTLMRIKIAAGNWKMNMTLNEAVMLCRQITEQLTEEEKNGTVLNCRMVLAPPFYFIDRCIQLTKECRNIYTGAQNCHWEEKGAYTGEVSAAMLAEMGTVYVILGHSERREYFKEDGAMLLKKVNRALNHGLKPIFCIGEKLEQREDGSFFTVVEKQLNESLFLLDVTEFSKTVIAYEPVWAIGTGLNATPEQAQEMHARIRKLIAEKYGNETAENTSILYGGSCNASNAKLLFSMPDVDGGLIGGASLKADEFINIFRSLA